MRIFFIMASFAVVCNGLSAQTRKQLEKDTNITWAAELTVAMPISPYQNPDPIGATALTFFKNRGIITAPIKRIEQAHENPLAATGWDALAWAMDVQTLQNQPIFADEALEKSLSADEARKLLYGVRTETKPNPQTNRLETTAQQTTLVPRRLSYLVARIWVYYDKKTAMFYAQPYAVAPCELVVNEEDSVLRAKPLYWIPVEKLPDELDPHSGLVIWGEYVEQRLHFADMRPFKQTETHTAIFKRYDADLRQRADAVQLLDYSDVLLAKDQVQALGVWQDTIIVFNPETFEELIVLRPSRVAGETVLGLVSYNEWFFDRQKRRLLVRTRGFAPINKGTRYEPNATGDWLGRRRLK